jgi:hypothetical protein
VAIPLGPDDIALTVYLHRESRWLLQTTVRTIPGFSRLWGPVDDLDATQTTDESLGAAVRRALTRAPSDRIAHDAEPAQTPWSTVGRGYRSFCRRTALVTVRRDGDELRVLPEENRSFVKPDPGFYARDDLTVRVPLDAPDSALGSAVSQAARAIPTPL